MRNLTAIRLAAILLLPPILTACAQPAPPKPEIETKIVYPALPATDCADEPAPPAKGASDGAIVDYFEAVRLAGADCRVKLNAVRGAQAQWPAQVGGKGE